jgi:hypothetical protein
VQLVVKSSGVLDVKDAFLCQQTDATDTSRRALKVTPTPQKLLFASATMMEALSAFGSQINADIRILLEKKNNL